SNVDINSRISTIYPYVKSFAEMMKQQLDVEVEQVDFASEEFQQNYGNWISDCTKGLINGSHLAKNIPADRQLMISSVAYFNDEWLTKFDQSKTYQTIFEDADSLHNSSIQLMKLKKSKTSVVYCLPDVNMDRLD
ncbi:Fanconi anemia group M protein-like protein, partial [Leptotrombidium deliense]